MAETPLTQPAQQTSATTQPTIPQPPTPELKSKPQKSVMGKNSIIALIVGLLFFAGGLGTWVYVEYFL